MAIRPSCPACEKNLKVKEELAGKRVKCPACGQIILVSSSRPGPLFQPTNSSPKKARAATQGKARAFSRAIGQRKLILWPWVVGRTVILMAVIGLGAFLLNQTMFPEKNARTTMASPLPGDLSSEKEKNEAPPGEPDKSVIKRWAEAAPGDKTVSVGKGSYADHLPSEAGEAAKKFESRELYLLKEDGRPIPTNQWWTDLLVSKFAHSLWASPLKIDTSEKRMDVFFPTRWAVEGNDPVSEFPLSVGGKDFKPADARAKNWSDWGIVFRMSEGPAKYCDVTLVRGIPCAWVEWHGVQPELKFEQGGVVSYFDLTGQTLPLPLVGDCLGIEYRERCYGLFAPDGTQFHADKEGVGIAFAGQANYLVLCALPARKDLETFHR